MTGIVIPEASDKHRDTGDSVSRAVWPLDGNVHRKPVTGEGWLSRHHQTLSPASASRSAVCSVCQPASFPASTLRGGTLLSTAIVTVGTAAFVNAAKWYGQCVCHCQSVVSVGYAFVTVTVTGSG